MATVVPNSEAADQEIEDLERQIQNLQRKRDAVLESRSGGSQDTFVPYPDKNLQRQVLLRKGILTYLREYGPLVAITAPVIYSTFLALLVLDLFMTLYQWICFPVYGIERVRRRDYIIIDHQHLGYLNLLEKLNCAFCSYANGLLAYSVEIGSRTEAFWCPIKHAAQAKGLHRRTEEFATYADGVSYRLKQQQNGKMAMGAANRIRQCKICRKRHERPK